MVDSMTRTSGKRSCTSIAEPSPPDATRMTSSVGGDASPRKEATDPTTVDLFRYAGTITDRAGTGEVVTVEAS
jgi:hypothetical protein